MITKHVATCRIPPAADTEPAKVHKLGCAESWVLCVLKAAIPNARYAKQDAEVNCLNALNTSTPGQFVTSI